MNEQRKRVIEVAKTWVGTGYHHMGRIKGVGADCLTLLAEVYHEAGITPYIEVPYYPHDWHLHRDEERYMTGLLEYAHLVETPKMGDVVLWKFGRCFSHGAIIVDWPDIIHAYTGRNCTFENAEQAEFLKKVGENGPDYGKLRPHKFFSFWND
jgi:cell wall-associated NlpC family hydrolase